MGRLVRKMGTQVRVAIISAISGAVITTFVIQVLIPAISKGFFAHAPVKITSPASGNKIPQHVQVQGKASRIPKDKRLWILVKAGGRHYFPQPGPVDVADDGTWITDAWVGSDKAEAIGKHYVLVAALADQVGNAAIDENLKRQNFPPLDSLTGIQLMNEVEVERF